MAGDQPLVKQIADLSNENADLRDQVQAMAGALKDARSQVQRDSTTRTILIMFLAGMTGAIVMALLWLGDNLTPETLNLVTMMSQGIMNVLAIGVGFYFGREGQKPHGGVRAGDDAP